MAAKVIPYQFWLSPEGKKYSFFTSWKPPGSELKTEGFTIMWPDGTTGTGRPPFKTAEEAEAYIALKPNFQGMGSLGN